MSAQVTPVTCPHWVVCHERSRSTRLRETVREMEEGPSGSAIRSLIPSHRELLCPKGVAIGPKTISFMAFPHSQKLKILRRPTFAIRYAFGKISAEVQDDECELIACIVASFRSTSKGRTELATVFPTFPMYT
jgi:hypothetical protein